MPLHVKCSEWGREWQYVRFIILTQLYKLFPPAGNCHHLLIFYISNIINASQGGAELAGLLTKQSSYLHWQRERERELILIRPQLCKIQPHRGAQVRLNYCILDTLIAPGPGVIDHQSISNEYYPIPNIRSVVLLKIQFIISTEARWIDWDLL